ncbi:MAG: gamma-glutamyltransferase family protein [Chloroflexia bacterium]
MAGYPPPLTYRPAVSGSRYMAATGHAMATMAAVRMLEAGGNAIDAGVAAGLCINVLQPDMTNLGGVAPIMLHRADEGKIWSISGLGWWPESVDREYFVRECGGTIPVGVRRCVMPAAADAWLTALGRFGTMPLAEVAAPAIALAEGGFSVYNFLRENIAEEAEGIAQWPSSAAHFLPQGRVPVVGERFAQPDLGRTLRMLVEAEAGAAHLGREAALRAARDRFYQGDIAERIAAFHAEQGSWLTLADLKSFSVEVEEPLSVRYRGYDFYGCQPWCQGPPALQALSILEGYDLASLGQNSADTLHLILEALKAAFADRERYYGDPRFVDVPTAGLLHPDYAAEWRGRIRLDRAFPGMPEPGDPRRYAGGGLAVAGGYRALVPSNGPVEPDTSYLCVVDEWGNVFSATPSDGGGASPIIPGLGFIVSGRGIQSWLDPEHPSAIAPRKRPRLTPSPGLIMRDGAVFAPYGTPGLDVQPQAMVQLAVNLIDFGMEPQAAIEAPRVASYSFPASSHPHPYSPGLVRAEGRLSAETLADLARRGHKVEAWGDFAAQAGALCTIVADRERGFLAGAADPRRMAYAMGW